MENKETISWVRRYARTLCIGAFVGLCVAIYCADIYRGHTHDPVLRVVFLDVGQGDAIFIESPTGVQVLVDGGVDNAVLRELSKEMGFFDRSIDMVVATHEDKDHVGGLPGIFARYEVGTFLRTENQGESSVAEEIDTLPLDQGIDVVYARRGMEFDLGDGVILSVLFPDRDPSGWESNTSSIVMRVTYGDSEFLLTGDSPQSIEKYVVSLYPETLESDVLKLGHHGSRTSSAEEFLDAVRPQYAIVSAEKDSRYGHPHQEVVDAVTQRGITLVSTAEEGSIVFESDGTTVRLR